MERMSFRRRKSGISLPAFQPGTQSWFLAPLLLAGCALHAGGPDSGANSRIPQEQREFNLQTTWSGRSYEALVQAFGPPELIMDVPGFRQLRTSAVVYGVRDSASQCIDAFTVVVDGRTGQYVVTNYFCR
jgi:hypothetical protein